MIAYLVRGAAEEALRCVLACLLEDLGDAILSWFSCKPFDGRPAEGVI